jgi:DNA-binding Xre family transcriptional regulator
VGNLAERLARKLRELRGDATIEAFAARLGISKSSLHRMELAEQNVSLRTIEKLCSRLKCTVAELFGEE